MDIGEIVNIALPAAFVLVGLALVWFVIELAIMMRSARKTVNNLSDQLKPTLENVEQLTESLEPVVAKADPLMERVNLTVDAANLELMRVDQILEDVGDITDGLSSATSVVENVANAPVELVTKAADRIRGIFSPKSASDESKNLGQAKAEAEAAKAVEASTSKDAPAIEPDTAKDKDEAFAKEPESGPKGAHAAPVQADAGSKDSASDSATSIN